MIDLVSPNKNATKTNKAGFSLVEMILAMGLLALLSVLFATLMVFAINMSSNAAGRTDDRLSAVGDSEIIYLDDDYDPPAGLPANELEIIIKDFSETIKVNHIEVNSGGQSYSAFYYTD